jgi:hypothetical protein
MHVCVCMYVCMCVCLYVPMSSSHSYDPIVTHTHTHTHTEAEYPGKNLLGHSEYYCKLIVGDMTMYTREVEEAAE